MYGIEYWTHILEEVDEKIAALLREMSENMDPEFRKEDLALLRELLSNRKIYQSNLDELKQDLPSDFRKRKFFRR